MNDRAAMSARHSRMLAELSELSLSLARNLRTSILRAETAAEAAEKATAFHDLSRSMRQIIALEAALLREHRELAARARPAPRPPTKLRLVKTPPTGTVGEAD